MALILGLSAAVVYGAGDFVGGLLTRRAGVVRVVVLSQTAGALLLAVVAVAVERTTPTPVSVVWGAGAGLAGTIGITLLYRGLAVGRMSVVAPITAVEASLLPVIVGLALGERPAPMALLGVLVALTPVALVSSAPSPSLDPSTVRSGLPEAFGAGAAFGAFYVLLERAGDAGLWPLLSARAASLLLLGTAVVVLRAPLRADARTFWGIVAAGVLDVTANALYLLATREGLLSIVAVLTSLYPASTVVLARLVLSERLARTQSVGLAFAVVGVGLIAAA